MFRTKVVEQIKTHFFYSITFFENRAVYEMVWEKSLGQSRLQMTTWCTHIARWIPKATNTLSEYVILIAVTLQHCNNGCTNAPQYYVIRTLPVFCTKWKYEYFCWEQRADDYVYGGMVEWYRQGNTEALEEHPVAAQLCPKWILFDCTTIVPAGSNNDMLLICAYILNIDFLLCCALCP
jgi:hypothetical protein